MSRAKSTRMGFTFTREQVAEMAKILGYQSRFFPSGHPVREAYQSMVRRLDQTLPMESAIETTQETLRTLQSGTEAAS